MKTPLMITLRKALVSINAQYGIGNVGKIILYADASGAFEQRPFKMRTRLRKFRVYVRHHCVIIFALKHQRTKMI